MHKIILQQIVNEDDNSKRWMATCQCGWCGKKQNKKECTRMAERHGDQPETLIGPRIFTSNTNLGIPKSYPLDHRGWIAYNDCDKDDEELFSGWGRSEDEAIDDLQRIDEIRRVARFQQNEGFPRNAAWLDFFDPLPAEIVRLKIA